ncbi:MAG: methyl-accepting chemotaxis protein [Spirochaetales bacterium]|nr:methyl-accepting chemotaxis protein [Spirochaetales bacterium]
MHFLGPLKRVSRQIHQVSGNEDIDLTLTLPPTDSVALKVVIGSLNHLTNRLNLIFLDISQSTRKFNLFASDNFFSARHVSEEAHSQSVSMGQNLHQVKSFQVDLEDLEAQLTRIRSHINESTRIHRELEGTNREATKLLELLRAPSKWRALSQAGLGVIAGEIRTLPTHSRKSILEIGDFLRRTRDEIVKGAERWSEEAQEAEQVKSLSEETQKSLCRIGESVRDIAQNIELFSHIFIQQNQSLEKSLGISTSDHTSVQEFSSTLEVQA